MAGSDSSAAAVITRTATLIKMLIRICEKN